MILDVLTIICSHLGYGQEFPLGDEGEIDDSDVAQLAVLPWVFDLLASFRRLGERRLVIDTVPDVFVPLL